MRRRVLLRGLSCFILFSGSCLLGVVVAFTLSMVFQFRSMTEKQSHEEFIGYLFLGPSLIAAAFGGCGGWKLAQRLYSSRWEWILVNLSAAGYAAPFLLTQYDPTWYHFLDRFLTRWQRLSRRCR